jgi:hypothetical protein
MKRRICLLAFSIVCAGIVAHGADVTAAEMADAYYWKALDEEGKICGGSWSEASNWLRNGAAVSDDGMKLIYESPALRGTQVLFK